MSAIAGVRGKIPGWLAMLKDCQAHLTEFWGRPYTEPENNEVEKTWLMQLADLNEEKLDGTSLSDMLYVIRCYLSVIRSRIADASLHEMYAFFHEIRLLGAHQTPYPSSAMLRMLEDKAAAFVVWQMGARKTDIIASLPIRIELSQDLAERVDRARCLAHRPNATEAVMDGNLPLKTDDVQPGTWWAAGREHMVYSFVATCSRVFHKLRWDEWVLTKLQPRTDGAFDESTAAHNRHMLREWLVERARMELPNEVMLLFRKTCFEYALPVSSLYAGVSRRNASLGRVVSPSTLMENECGFLAASQLNTAAGVSVQTVAEDESHPFHEQLVATLFHNQFQQGTSKKHQFIGNHFLTAQRITNHPEFMSLLSQCTKWGMNKRPVIAQLQRRLIVIDTSGPDHYNRETEEASKHLEYVECRDIYQALLYWIYLMHYKYSDELECSTVLKRCYDGLIPVLRQ
jgi:hypothetical protein